MTLLSLDTDLTLDEHGQKATLLARARKLGERTPDGFVIDARMALAMARGAFQEGELARALESLGATRVAVRSSPSLSLPGALATELDVPADPASPPTLDDLRSFAKEHLPAWAAPKSLELVSSLPRTSLGKIRRRDLSAAHDLRRA